MYNVMYNTIQYNTIQCNTVSPSPSPSPSPKWMMIINLRRSSSHGWYIWCFYRQTSGSLVEYFPPTLFFFYSSKSQRLVPQLLSPSLPSPSNSSDARPICLEPLQEYSSPGARMSWLPPALSCIHPTYFWWGLEAWYWLRRNSLIMFPTRGIGRLRMIGEKRPCQRGG